MELSTHVCPRLRPPCTWTGSWIQIQLLSTPPKVNRCSDLPRCIHSPWGCIDRPHQPRPHWWMVEGLPQRGSLAASVLREVGGGIGWPQAGVLPLSDISSLAEYRPHLPGSVQRPIQMAGRPESQSTWQDWPRHRRYPVTRPAWRPAYPLPGSAGQLRPSYGPWSRQIVDFMFYFAEHEPFPPF